MEIPAECEWVKVRLTCTPFHAFEALRERVSKDVVSRDAAVTKTERQDALVFDFDSKSPEYFYAGCERKKSIIRFYLKPDQIEISGDGIELMVLTLTVNAAGQCRYRVNGKGEFAEWQVTQLALEKLFFDPIPPH